MLDLRNVTRSYAGRSVLGPVTVRATPGCTALLGPNGAGKSSLLDILAMVKPPSSGEVLWRGAAVNGERSARKHRGHITYLPQHFEFPRSYTASDAISYAAWLRGLKAVDTHAALDALGLADAAKKRVSTMSGGMKQRLGIATCLIGSPELIILDEPTVGLDPGQRVGFRNEIRAQSAPVFLSTHLVEDAVALADRVIVLHEGTTIFEGTVTQLEEVGGTVGDSPAERGYMRLIQARS